MKKLLSTRHILMVTWLNVISLNIRTVKGKCDNLELVIYRYCTHYSLLLNNTTTVNGLMEKLNNNKA